MNKNAACITVYKNRYTTMLEMIKDVDESFDVFIVAQENDPNLNDYYCYGAEVLVPNVKSIFDKREYIRNEMIRRGYEGFIMIDDDIKDFMKITEETKRTTSDSYKTIPASLNEVLHKLVDTAKEYNCGFASPLGYCSHLGLSTPHRVIINRAVNCAQMVYLKTSALVEHDLHYDVTGDLNEDLDMMLQFYQHGINCCTLGDYAYRQTNVRYSKKQIETSTLYNQCAENMERMAMKITEKYNMELRIRQDGHIENKSLNLHKYFNTFELPEIDEKILELCKSNNIEELRKYLIDNGMVVKKFKANNV